MRHSSLFCVWYVTTGGAVCQGDFHDFVYFSFPPSILRHVAELRKGGLRAMKGNNQNNNQNNNNNQQNNQNQQNQNNK